MCSELTSKFIHPEFFHTDRYFVRKVKSDDGAKIYEAYGTDVDVARFLTWTPASSALEIDAYVGSLMNDWDTGASFAAVICPRDEPDRLLGMVHTRVREGTLNFGYVLASTSWGIGCMTEVLTSLVDIAFASPAVVRVEAVCDVDNHASARVLEKVGLKLERTLVRHAVHPNIAEEPRDCRLYSAEPSRG